ncbi:MAG: hypothetical protein RIQ68_1829 [Pseudomonadota bacterium]
MSIKKKICEMRFFSKKKRRGDRGAMRIAQIGRITPPDMRPIQIPNFCLRRSFTDCGFAFPPVCFIT